MKTNILTIAALTTLLSTHVFAGSMGIENESEPCWGPAGSCWGTPKLDPPPLQTVLSLSAGPAWTAKGTAQTVLLPLGNVNTYSAISAHHLLGSGELFLGKQKQLNQKFSAQAGIELGLAGQAQFEGNVYTNSDPNFNYYTYRYDVAHARVAAKAKLLAHLGHRITPYVSASLGIGSNRASGFTTSPLITNPPATPQYTSNTRMTIPYTLGLGVQGDITETFQLGLGYEFLSWGRSELGNAVGQIASKTICESNIYSNVFLVTATYVLG